MYAGKKEKKVLEKKKQHGNGRKFKKKHYLCTAFST